MSLLVQDLPSAFRILLHIWTNRVHNAALQHIYSLKATEILLLSEGKKGMNPEYIDKLIKPPVLRDQSTLIAHVPSGVESPLPWPAHPGVSEQEYRHAAGANSSALALQLPHCRATGTNSSGCTLPALTPQLHQLGCNSSTSWSPLRHPSPALETPQKHYQIVIWPTMQTSLSNNDETTPSTLTLLHTLNLQYLSLSNSTSLGIFGRTDFSWDCTSPPSVPNLIKKSCKS